MIQFESLNIGYQKSLAKVELENLKAGEIVALIGSNGSGKSTFLKTVCGIQKPYSGRVLLNGQEIHRMTQARLADLIAFVPPHFPLLEYTTVFDFIALGRTPHLSNFGKLSKKDMKIIEEIIDLLNLHKLKNQYTSLLSDGERQKCALGRALAQQTSVILLDEPSGYLDVKNKQRLVELLIHIAQSLNKLILFSTHDLEVIKHKSIQKIGIQLTEKDEGASLVKVKKTLTMNELIEQFYR